MKLPCSKCGHHAWIENVESYEMICKVCDLTDQRNDLRLDVAARDLRIADLEVEVERLSPLAQAKLHAPFG